ncbi:signal peptidase II [Kocuria palustris]|uniref:signal peptidase II n=1 Tax=Kocuria palustris TaxID=71999 RepID=UPI0011A55E6A|nr:signal peptidase II [Kocuria palustris]
MSSPAASAPQARPRSRRAVLALAILTAAVVYGLDQATKAIVERTMTLGQEIPLIDGLLQWHYILNPGAAFSMGESLTWVFTAVMAIASAGILLFLPRVRSLLWALSLGLVLGGALGNLTDRLLRWPGFPNGHVVDFIHVQGFAVFNIADSGVVVGVILVAALILLGRDPDGSRAADRGDGR